MNSLEQFAADIAKDLPNFSPARRQEILATLPVETVKPEVTETTDTLVTAKDAKPTAQPLTVSESSNKPTPATLVQPDAQGEFPTPLDGALWMASFGIPQTPLRGKAPFLMEWQNSATTDPVQIRKWASEYPGCNFGSVAKKGEWFVFEADSPDIWSRMELVGCTRTAKLMVRSRKGRGHCWYRWAEGVENISQAYTKHGDFSVRANNEQCVSPGSLHPATGEQYRVVASGTPEKPSTQEIAFWKSEKKTDAKDNTKGEPERNAQGLIPKGSVHGYMLHLAGQARHLGQTPDEIEPFLLRKVHENCEAPIDEDRVKAMAASMAKYPEGDPAKEVIKKDGVLEMTGDKLSHNTEDEFSQSSIPPFDPSVIKGFYKEATDELIKGTTLQPQFTYSIIKAVVGAKMAGHVKFDDLDVQPLMQLALCGDSSAGKGEAWRRVLRMLKADLPGGMLMDDKSNPITCNAKVKILESVDSGAGLKDAFFEKPDEQPIILYFDETESLGHKAGEKKNPEILDTIGELADSTTVARAKAKRAVKSPSAKKKDDAYLVAILCGQTADVFTSAFTGRKNIGWRVRLTPEHGTKQEVGDLPPVPDAVLARLLRKLNGLPYSGTMSTSAEAKDCLEKYWASLPSETRTEPRYKKQIKLDAYKMAFGRGVKVVELSDMEDAVKNFTRQLAIRRVYFRGEAPDRMGFYLGGINELTDWMRTRLAEGLSESQVARTWTDYEDRTNCRRNGEDHIFERAMYTHAKHHLRKILLKAGNGHTYEKYLPIPTEGRGV